jgi:hypothetical protein
MKRVFATVGVMGLALLAVTAPASAANEIYLCHATKSGNNVYAQIGINNSGLHGHDKDPDDIIPPNEFLPDGLNWDAAGQATNANGCEPTLPPVVVPEVDPPVVPEVVPEVVTPVVVPEVAAPVVVPEVVTPVVVAPAAQTPVPKAAAAKAPAAAAAPVSQGTNQGYNAQTAVGGSAGDGAPTWLGGLGALLAAGLAVAARRRSRTV